MEEKKQEFPSTQDNFGASSKGFPKSIMRCHTILGLPNKKCVRRSQTMDSQSKGVSFADKHQKPLQIVHHIEPFIYEEQPSHKEKYKASCCVVF